MTEAATAAVDEEWTISGEMRRLEENIGVVEAYAEGATEEEEKRRRRRRLRWRRRKRTARGGGLVAVFFLFQSLGLCCSLNEEGNALLKFRQKIVSDPFGALSNWVDDDSSLDPCNWFGVECSDGRVVALNLKDLYLEGTLALELAKLIHINSRDSI